MSGPLGHVPVLLNEVVGYLNPQAGEQMLDCTCGLGGHSMAILERGAAVTGIDRDPDARDRAAHRLAEFGDLFQLRGGGFASAATELVAEGARFDGVLADLGVSSLQLDDLERGFSIRSESTADMRMGDDCSGDAISFIASTSRDELVQCLKEYGEVPMAGRIARVLQEAVANGRTQGLELAEAVRSVVPGHHKRHPAIPVFQALRMAVNDELGEIKTLLELLPELLNPGGRAVIISFHSLEDRLVKRAFRFFKNKQIFADMSRKVVMAGEAELAHNNRAHSAKLRWAVRSDA